MHIPFTTQRTPGVQPRLFRLAAAGALLLLPLAACDVDSLLSVDDPSVVRPERLEDPSALPTVLAGAIGDFAEAYSGDAGGEGQILTSGLLADEWRHSGTFPTRLEVDQRTISIDNATTQGVFRDLSRARVAAEFAADAYDRVDPGAEGHATALSLAGFAYILFGENYCNGVPFSEADEQGQFTFGEPLTGAQIFQRAIERFDAAIAVAEPGSDEAYLAMVGKARALLNLGEFAQAATIAAGVPTDFEFSIAHSDNTNREQNGVFVFNWIVGRWSVAGNEGINGLPFLADSLDPRTPSMRALTAGGNPRNGFDRRTPLYGNLKYPDRGADTPLATGVEAELIEAEADLQAGSYTAALARLNALRADAATYLGAGATLPPLAPAVGADAQEDQLFKERAYWLWLTSHRLGDLRRLIRQYQRTEDQVFPTGDFFKGGVYGNDVNFPVPVDELNNPKFTQCLDRNA